MNNWVRLTHMILGWGGVGLIYSATGSLQGQGTILPETALDRMIPYDPNGIWLYLVFFALVPYAYFSIDADRVRWLMRSMLVCAAFSGVIFMVYPSTLHYPPVGSVGASERLLSFLLSIDTKQNCLPSLHGALTLLCVWALWDRRKPIRTLSAVLLGVGIGYAIIQLRRHVSIDLSAGILIGLISGWLCNRSLHFLRRPQVRTL